MDGEHAAIAAIGPGAARLVRVIHAGEQRAAILYDDGGGPEVLMLGSIHIARRLDEDELAGLPVGAAPYIDVVVDEAVSLGAAGSLDQQVLLPAAQHGALRQDAVAGDGRRCRGRRVAREQPEDAGEEARKSTEDRHGGNTHPALPPRPERRGSGGNRSMRSELSQPAAACAACCVPAVSRRSRRPSEEKHTAAANAAFA